MFTSYIAPVLQEAEAVAQAGDIAKVYEKLRSLTLADQGLLNLYVPDAYPALKGILPFLPSQEAQMRWVGDSGLNLQIKTANIARLFQIMAYKHMGKSLSDLNILDYGCGWGRILRFMNYLAPLENIYGVDVMESSLDECRKSHVPNKIEMCDRRPVDLPFEGVTFDFIYAFSVFTHLPEDVATTVLKAIRKRVAADGVLIATLLPVEYWNTREGKEWPKPETLTKMRTDYAQKGYAFNPHHGSNNTYGDTTYTFEFYEALVAKAGWEMVDVERELSDPYQLITVLKPV